MPDVFTPRQAEREAKRIILHGGKLPRHAKDWDAAYRAAVARACLELSPPVARKHRRSRHEVAPPPSPPPALQDSDAHSWTAQEDAQLLNRLYFASALIEERARQSQHIAGAASWAKRMVDRLFPMALFSQMDFHASPDR